MKMAMVAIDTVGTMGDCGWEFALDTVKESANAICYNVGNHGVWFPKSQIKESGITSNGGYIVIPVWLAKDKGLLTGSVVL